MARVNLKWVAIIVLIAVTGLLGYTNIQQGREISRLNQNTDALLGDKVILMQRDSTQAVMINTLILTVSELKSANTADIMSLKKDMKELGIKYNQLKGVTRVDMRTEVPFEVKLDSAGDFKIVRDGMSMYGAVKLHTLKGVVVVENVLDLYDLKTRRRIVDIWKKEFWGKKRDIKVVTSDNKQTIIRDVIDIDIDGR